MTSKENQASTDFSTLALSPTTLANLQQLGYTTMTPIQAASLPPALLGKDLIAQASTGSGKTAAFALALLANLNPRRFAVQALVLCPTRELADQVTTEIRRLARAEENIKVVTLCGGGIAKLSAQFMKQPEQITVQAQHAEGKIEQRWYEVKNSERLHVVSQLLNHFRPESSIAFCNTKQQCRDLVGVLQAQGFSALALYGELEQRERDQVLVQFANRSCSVLVATDVAARGLDIANLAAVINVDVTPDPEVHIHRIGRTGRGDAQGLALNLASMDEMGYVGKIEVLQGRESTWFALADLTPTGNGPLQPPMATIQIVGGRKEKIRAGDVLGALTGDLGYTREQVGKINVNDFSTYVAVDRAIAAQVAARLNSGRVKGKSEWNPVLAPAGLPKEERQRLFEALNKALKVPEVVSKVQALGGEVFPNTTDGLAAGFIKTQQVQWRRVIAARKIQAG
eukprot:gene7145-6988_t